MQRSNLRISAHSFLSTHQSVSCNQSWPPSHLTPVDELLIYLTELFKGSRSKSEVAHALKQFDLRLKSQGDHSVETLVERTVRALMLH